MHVVPSRNYLFSINSEANASELQENLENDSSLLVEVNKLRVNKLNSSSMQYSKNVNTSPNFGVFRADNITTR